MIEYKTLSFKAATEGLQANEFEGYASTFLGVDSYGDIIAPGAFKGTTAFFLTDGMILWNHRTSQPIGKPLSCYEDSRGLYIKGKISDTAQGRDTLTLMRDDVVRKMSIGFETLGYEMLSEARAIEVIGSGAYEAAMKALPWWSDGLRLLTEIKLYEVSPVPFPANGEADILGVKSAGRLPETEREFEKMLRDAGFSRKQALAVTSAGFKALQRDAAGDEAETSADFDELAASIKALTATLQAS